ncbi:MAG TPA: SRPBCC family protein [Acidimicrobiales bacterium]|nr:SRPBCC family protein [Acidimicrobiales bacterium]
MTDRRASVTLPSDTEILITRQFDASPELVYRAYTTPELVSRWWVGQRGVMKSCEIDLRVGGKWRYVMEANAGFEVAFHGVYEEIVPDAKLVSSEVFEGMPDAESRSIITFDGTGAGGTLLRVLVGHATREHRDAHVASGMEDGLQEAMDALEGLLRPA